MLLDTNSNFTALCIVVVQMYYMHEQIDINKHLYSYTETGLLLHTHIYTYIDVLTSTPKLTFP